MIDVAVVIVSWNVREYLADCLRSVCNDLAQSQLTGETWVDDEDPHLWVIISTWIGPELWQAWQSGPERQVITAKLEPLLAAPEKIRVLQSWGAVEVDWNVRRTLPAA